MTRRSRRPLRSDLNVHEKTTKDEGEFLESCDRTTKGWCKVFNENSLVPDIEQSVFRLDEMLLGNVNMTTTEGYKFRPESLSKDEKITSPRQMRSSEKIRSRKSMEDLEAKGKDFKTNSLTCDGGVEAWKKELSFNDCLGKDSTRSSLKVALSVTPKKTRESRKSGSLSPVENLYMELQNGESSGERFVNPSGVALKNGRLSNRLFDSGMNVQAFCKAVNGPDSVTTSIHSSDLESNFPPCEQDSTSRTSTRPALTKSYPRRNGIFYRNRTKSESHETEEAQEPLNSLAVVCFVDEKDVPQNTSFLDCGGGDKSIAEAIGPDSEGDITHGSDASTLLDLPPKRHRRPPQSYSPSSTHESRRLTRRNASNALRRKTTLARQLSFTADGTSVKEENDTEGSESTVVRKRQRTLKKDKVNSEASTVQPKTDQSSVENISYVLGMRRLYKGANAPSSQVLVQFKDGTSNWVASDVLETMHLSLGEFLCDSHQNLHVINRLPYRVHCSSCPSTAGKPSAPQAVTKVKRKDELQSVNRSNDTGKVTVRNEEIDGLPSGLSAATHSAPQIPPHAASTNCAPFLDSNEKTSLTSNNPGTRHLDNSIHNTPNNVHHGNFPLSTDPLRSGMLTNILYNSNFLPSRTPSKEIEVTKHDTFVHIVVRGKHASHKNKRVSPEICDELIEHLEHYSVDDSVRLVVLSGLEDHFSTKGDLIDVSRLPSWMEGHECKQSVLKLRYLFQTVRYYSKPLVAVISHPSRGLSASLLSLFDMVFDKERGVELFEPSSRKAKELSVLFPRLMGIAAKSEQLLMGERVDHLLEERLSQTEVAFRGTKYTYNLTESMKDVKGNLRKRHFAPTTPPKDSSTVCPFSPNGPSLSASVTPTSLEKKRMKETDFIKKQIEREKELANSCLRDISFFWNGLRNQDLEEVLS